MSPIYEVIDPRFSKLVAAHLPLDELYSGCLFAEGPAYFPAGRYLLWTDIQNNRILRFDETNRAVSVLRQDCGYPNGQTRDLQGRLITCEHEHRRVTRTEHDGRVVSIAEAWDGKRLNSPNDVVAKSDGSIWFTDPPYGILHDLDGAKGEQQIPGCYVYRIDPENGAVTAIITDMVWPNGLAFSGDEKTLYVVDSAKSHIEGAPAHVRAFRLSEGAVVLESRVFADCPIGIFDGLRVDSEENVWVGGDDGVYCYNQDGSLLGKIRTPGAVGNLVFGGPKRNWLYICATNSLYRVFLKVNGRER